MLDLENFKVEKYFKTKNKINNECIFTFNKKHFQN